MEDIDLPRLPPKSTRAGWFLTTDERDRLQAHWFKGGAESAAQTVEAIAAAWQAPPEQKAAVDLFVEMAATAIREAAEKVTNE